MTLMMKVYYYKYFSFFFFLNIVLLLLIATTTTTLASPIVYTKPSTISSSRLEHVRYECSFTNLWTKDRHPLDYPERFRFWSRQVVVSHPSSYTLWKEGSIAKSPGVKELIDDGKAAYIIKDLEDSNIFTYEVEWELYGGNEDSDDNGITTQYYRNPIHVAAKDNHYISSIVKMSPSPDWFTGISSFDTIDAKTGNWYDEITFLTYPYDGGTVDGGGTYTSGDEEPTMPQDPIREFNSTYFPGDGIFISKDVKDLLPVAKYDCNLLESTEDIRDVVTIDSTISSKEDKDMDVQYNCKFENLWNANRHPQQYPSFNNNNNDDGNNDDDDDGPHWTKQIVTIHDESYQMWSEGKMASRGIKEMMTEDGRTASLIEDIAIINKEHILTYDIGSDFYIEEEGSSITNKGEYVEYEPFKMSSSSEQTYMSAIMKLSPSPDWFTGFYDFNTINTRTGNWYKKFIIPLYPYDAGVKDGNTYTTTTNSETTQPQEPITKMTMENYSETIFYNPKEKTVLPLGTMTCTLEILKKKSTTTTTNPWKDKNDDKEKKPLSKQKSTTTPNNNKKVATIIIGTILGIFVLCAILWYLKSKTKLLRTKKKAGSIPKTLTDATRTNAETKENDIFAKQQQEEEDVEESKELV